MESASPVAPGRRTVSPREDPILWAVLFVALAVRLVGLTNESLWTDELLRTTWARGVEIGAVVDTLPSKLGRHAHVDGTLASLHVINRHTTPLQSVFINRYLRWFAPNDDSSLRLPFVLFGVLAVLGAALMAWELGGRTVGLLTGLLAALSPFQVDYSQEVNHYAMALCFSAFSGWYFLRFLKRGAVKDGVLWGVCGLLGLYTHYYVGLVLAAQGVAMLPWLVSDWRRAPYLLFPVGLMIAGFAPYVGVIVRQTAELTSNAVSGEFGGFPHFTERLGEAFTFPWFGGAAAELPGWARALAGLGFVALIFLGWTVEPDRRLKWFVRAGVLVPWAMLFTAYWVRENNTHLWPRYALFASPAAYISLALLVARGALRFRVVALALVGGAMIGGLVFLNTTQRKEDWRGVANIINGSAVAGEAVVVDPFVLTPLIAYYLTVDNLISSIGGPEQVPWLAARLAKGQGVFSVRAWGTRDLPTLLEESLGCHFLKKTTTHVFGLKLTHFTSPVIGDEPGGHCPESSQVSFERGGCWVDGPSGDVVATGWITAPAGDQRVEFVDVFGDRVIGAAALEASAEPSGGAARRAYRANLAVTALPVGALRPVSVRLAADGVAPQALGRQVMCLRRPAPVAWPGLDVARSRMEAVADTTQGQPALLSGWAFSSAGVSEVILRIDGTEVARTHLVGTDRPDVATFFPEVDAALARLSGFSQMVDTSTLSPGFHVATASVVLLDGTVTPVERQAQFMVRPPTGARAIGERGNLERLEPLVPGKTLVLTGWAFSAMGLLELKVSIDGVEHVRLKPPSIDRPDVAAAVSELNPRTTLRSGFSDKLEIGELPPGLHKVRVEMVHPNGSTAPVAGELTFIR